MRLCTAIVCSLLLAGAPARPQTASKPAQQQNGPAAGGPTKIDPAKEADIRKLLELSGVETLAKQTMVRMLEGLKPLMASTLPPGQYREELVNLFSAKFQSKADPKQLIDMAVPIYDKLFLG